MIAILNYGLGNLTSVLNMFRRVGVDATITSKLDEIRKADKLVLPGVGHFRKGIENLKETGLQKVLNDLVLHEKKPILGICLGAQLMTNHSEEGDINGLQWIDAKTVRFHFGETDCFKIPHMGWNETKLLKESKLFFGLESDARFYFVHSYHFVINNSNDSLTTTDYGYEFVSSFQKENIYGVQFHPEKSHKFGMKLLENFVNYA